LCSCPEPDCSHEPLEACECDYASKERQKIVADVRRLGYGTPEKDAATFATIRLQYLATHRVEPKEAPSAFAGALRIAGFAIACLLGAMGLFWLVERLRSGLARTDAPRAARPHFMSQSKRKKTKRRRS
jgi:hypothetical protein